MTAQRKYIERKRQMVSMQGNGTLLVTNKQHTLLVVISDRPSKTKLDQTHKYPGSQHNIIHKTIHHT